MNAALPCRMRRRLGDFTADVGIEASVQSSVNKPLCSTGAPTYPLDRSRTLANPERFTVKLSGDVKTEFLWRHRFFQLTLPDQTAERAWILDIENVRQLTIVPVFGMVIQREVVGDKIDFVVQKLFQAFTFHALDSLVLTFPEVTMVDQDHICVCFNGGFDERF
eukprot:TRINITY_DN3134_c0_g1_i1.p4 TRINITY_DN3134_c0_g1~~TRINITY_DN3134_c0_g1_i1.p4  ORF type:complete len:164 (-),score=24.16 TRINITY_DN3134_c0_g1_i1:180-671(-)